MDTRAPNVLGTLLHLALHAHNAIAQGMLLHLQILVRVVLTTVQLVFTIARLAQQCVIIKDVLQALNKIAQL